MRLSARDFGQFASQAPLELPIRRDLRWDFEDVQTRFVADDVLISYLWAAFSIGAPAIERFFVAALRPQIEHVADGKLRQEMDGMLTQEAMHAATHARFNRALAEKGLPIHRAEAYVEDLVARLGGAGHTARDLVGMVAAGEHIMHSLARIYLSDPSIGAAMAPRARRMFEYHMLEEVEHSSVSYDAFVHFCGHDYALRVRTGLLALIHIMDWFLNTMAMLVEDGAEPITSTDWGRFWRYGLFEPGVFSLMAVHIAEYFSPFYALRTDPNDQVLKARYQSALYAAQPG